MSAEKVREALKLWNKDKDIIEFPVSSATVELAAKAAGVIPARIAKTLSFKLKDGTPILISAAGDVKIDNKKYKSQFLCKATMLTPEEVLEFTGHQIGGVCPFAIENDKTKVYLDISLREYNTVFPAAGSSNSAIELTPEELFRISGALGWIDVCKPIENGD